MQLVKAYQVFELLKPRPTREELGFILYLDNSMQLLDLDLVRGDGAQVTFEHFRVVDRCHDLKATGVIVAHTHPYGFDVELSEGDLEAHKTMKKFLSVRGIKLLDSLVLSNDKYDSYANRKG